LIRSVQTRVANFFLNRKGPLESQLLVLLGVAAFLVRIWGISKTHFWDEMVYLQNAQVICCGKINYSELDFRPPLISLIYAGVFLLWHHIYAACIVTAVINAVGPVFLYLAGRLAMGRLPAAIAALLLAFSPFFVGLIPGGLASDDTGNSLLTDSPALTLLLVAFWLLLRALDRQSALRFAWAGLVLALSILMRFGTLPIVGMLFVLPLAAKRRWKALIWCGAGLLVGLAPYLLWSRLSFGGFFFTIREGWTHAEESREPALFYLQNAAAILSPLALFGIVIAATSWLWLPLVAIPSRPRLPSTFPSNLSPLLLHAFLWMWLLMGFVLFSAMPHKEPRYILPIAPPFLLLAGSGLALCCTFPARTFRRVGALVVAASLLFTFFPLLDRLSRPFIDRSEPVEMLASQFLQTSLPPGTILNMSFNYPAFAFYTNFRIHELSAVGPVLYEDIENIPPGGVLIVYRNTDEVREPNFEWVDANPKFRRMRDFTAFVIYRRLAEAGQNSL
jgi:4-amino-4-deoxy-L-arabinose transferase-like glycosyltransferase